MSNYGQVESGRLAEEMSQEPIEGAENKYSITKKGVELGDEMQKMANSLEKKVDSAVGSLEEKPGEYKGVKVEEYIQKKVDYVTKLEGMDEATKNKVLEKMKTMPKENLNGFVYGLEQNLIALKGGNLNAEQFGKKVDLGIGVCNRDYTNAFANIEKKLGADFVKNNAKLFEIGFVGMQGETEASVAKKVEEASKANNVSKTEQYYIVQALMNAHGMDRVEPEPIPKPAPVVTPTSTVTGDGSNSFSGFGSMSNGADFLPKDMSDRTNWTIDQWDSWYKSLSPDDQKKYEDARFERGYNYVYDLMNNPDKGNGSSGGNSGGGDNIGSGTVEEKKWTMTEADYNELILGYKKQMLGLNKGSEEYKNLQVELQEAEEGKRILNNLN